VIRSSNNDVRIEPKFEIPSGAPYTGGWCRPQTDGPGLRARTLSNYGNVLVKAGLKDKAKADVFPLVAIDMDWVTANW
jgi:glucoamylase